MSKRRRYFLALGVLLCLGGLVCSEASIAVTTHRTRKASSQQRFALVVGHQQGDRLVKPLRFAHRDAQRVTHLLKELGGYRRQNVVLLLSPTPKQVLAAMAQIKKRLQGKQRSSFLFYYSGHARMSHFLLGKERLAFSVLTRFAKRLPVKVRLLIVDSCYSGGVIAAKGAKGARRRRSIKWRMSLWPQRSKGLAILTSSGANELSYESEELEGSFFTSHLLAGLRGAADRNRDHRVSLSEIRQYVYLQTLSHSLSKRAVHLQRPAHHIQMQGQGPLFLTFLRRAESRLVLPAKLAGACFLFQEGQLLHEFEKRSGRVMTVGLRAGAYQLRIRRKGWLGSYRTQLKQRERHHVQQRAIAWEQVSVQQQMKGGVESELSTGIGLLIDYNALSNLTLHGTGLTLSVDARRWLHLALRYHLGAQGAALDPFSTHELSMRLAFGYGVGWNVWGLWGGGFFEPRLTWRSTSSRGLLTNAGAVMGLLLNTDCHFTPSLALRMSASLGAHVILFEQQTRWAPMFSVGFGLLWRV